MVRTTGTLCNCVGEIKRYAHNDLIRIDLIGNIFFPVYNLHVMMLEEKRKVLDFGSQHFSNKN